MEKVLFVEDDVEVGQLIATYLNKHDLEVVIETRGDTALAAIASHQPDLVLLDIMLPGKDGMTLCRELRPIYAGPIVLLTSLDSDISHILALELGANDYLVKTMPPNVLLARLRAHLRQHAQALPSEGIATSHTLSHTSIAPKLNFGQLTIDYQNRHVQLAHKTIFLSTADFDLLWMLACNAGRIMDRSALLQQLRGVDYNGFDRSIDVAISRLRKKLLDNATEPLRIKTIRHKGYLFAPDAWDDDVL